MELKIKDSLESIKIYGRYLSEFLLPDQIDVLAKSLQKDIEQELTLTDVGVTSYCDSKICNDSKGNLCNGWCKGVYENEPKQ